MKKFVVLLAGLMSLAGVSPAQPGVIGTNGSTFGPRVNAAIVVTSGENYNCSFGNINVAWIAYFTGMPYVRSKALFFTSNEQCVVIRVKLPIGSKVGIGGVLQDRLAIQGLSAQKLPTVNEGCFNVEGYSVGLVDNPDSIGPEIDPTDPNNIVNAQGYGLFWEMDDANIIGAGGRSFIVKGCHGLCPQSPTKYNTDTGFSVNDCEWLPPVQ